MAPTNFSNRVDLDDGLDPLLQSPGLHLRDNGGPATFQNLSIRGSRAKDLNVTLEGVPLNSPSSGDFDFGMLSPFGLGETRIIRGGYSWNSSRPNGEVMLKLPSTENYRARFGLGSYQSVLYGVETPFATFSFDRADNDYRKDNAHSRINLRTWYRKENFQTWFQLLYVDLELPGSTDFPVPPSRTQTLRPTGALQWRNKNWEVSARLDFQNQAVKDAATNRWYSAGTKLNYRKKWNEFFAVEAAVDQSADKLISDNFSSDFRSTTALSASTLISASAKTLFHPHLRIEFVSDLSQVASVHPGLGATHSLSEATRVLWNISFIQRAPNFNEMYFRIPNFYEPNRNLDRENSIQADMGFETRVENEFQWTQTFFVDRKTNLLESGPIGGGLFQTQNQNSSILYGIETDFLFHMTGEIDLETNYCLQWSRVSTEKTDFMDFSTPPNARQAYYLPLHKWVLKPILFPNRLATLSLPVYARSSVLASNTGDRVPPQFDLGLDLKTQAVSGIFPFEFRLKLRNLIGWNRVETKGYPLPSEPTFQTSLTYLF